MAEMQWSDQGPHSLGTVLTCGANGIIVTTNGGGQIHIAATNTGPVDVTGAGDTMIAVLSAAIAVGYDLERAARLANAAAGVVVGKFGTATCTIEELEEAWSRVSRTAASTSCMKATAIS
jgi:D-beta-D-heptose 7-phosphate kinase/D-beta-D-heptose 1-phosphate adenosyltransferase